VVTTLNDGGGAYTPAPRMSIRMVVVSRYRDETATCGKCTTFYLSMLSRGRRWGHSPVRKRTRMVRGVSSGAERAGLADYAVRIGDGRAPSSHAFVNRDGFLVRNASGGKKWTLLKNNPGVCPNPAKALR